MTPKSNTRLKRYAGLVLALVVLVAVSLCGCMFLLNWVGNIVLGRETDVAIRTWRDDNRNGVREEGEPGVAYVVVYADDVTEGDRLPIFSTTVGRDGRGRAEINTRSDERLIEFYPTIPAGYELTTPERVQLGIREITRDGVAFGFALRPGQPTPTPRPTAELACRLVLDNRQAKDVVKLLTGPDSSVVMVLRNADRLLHFAADGSPLPAPPVPPDYEPSPVRLLIAPDGRAWAWGELMADGQAYLDGEEWVAITPYEHPGDQKVYTLAVTAEGAVWLGTDVGALRRDPDTGAWSRFAADERITSVLPAADGTVWLLSNWETPWRLTPGGPRLYEEREFLARHEIAHTFLGAHPAESGVWIATGLGVARFDAATETWVHYTAETTHNALEPDLNWEYTPASDGGLWLTQGDELFYARPEEGLWLLVEVPVLVEGESIGNILATADGAVWLNNRQGVFRCRR